MHTLLEPYAAAVIQCDVKVIGSPAEKDKTIRENLARDCELLDYLFEDPLYAPKLVVFPEFFLQGSPKGGKIGRRLVDYQMISISIPGEYTDVLARKAVEHGIYIVGCSDESDSSWPGRVFQCSYIIDPNGKIILKYRKLHEPAGRCSTTTPPDVFTDYSKKYGDEAFFPVVDTPLGKLACMVCYDVNFPETARILAMRGAEVIAMPTGESNSFGPKHALLRRARAIENSAYIVCANHGDTLGSHRPVNQQFGHSSIIDYNGQILSEIEGPGEAITQATIDLGALRTFRKGIGQSNLLPQVRSQFYAKFYEKYDLWPLDVYLKDPVIDTAASAAAMKKVIEKMEKPKLRQIIER